MSKKLATLIFLFFVSFSPVLAQSIDPLSPWVSTTSPVSAVTQKSYGKSVMITGLTTGLCLTLNSNNVVTTTSCGSGGGGTFPFTSNSWGNSTSTTIGFYNGLFSNASSTFASSVRFPSLSAGGLALDSNGLLYTAATTTAGAGLSTSGNSFILDLTNPNSFTGLQTFQYSSTTRYSSFVTASTTNLILNGSSFNSLLGSGLTNSSGALTVSLSSLTATDGSLTFSGSYNGLTARTIGLNLGNSNTWTVNQNFNYSSSTSYSSFVTASTTNLIAGTASTTNQSVTGQLWIPNSSTASTTTLGQVAVDTTAGELHVKGTSESIFNPVRQLSLTFATSTAWTGTTTINLPSSFIPLTINQLMCYADTGTLDVDLYHGTTHLTMIIASTTQGIISFTSNNTLGVGEKWGISAGTSASSPTQMPCTINTTSIAQ